MEAEFYNVEVVHEFFNVEVVVEFFYVEVVDEFFYVEVVDEMFVFAAIRQHGFSRFCPPPLFFTASRPKISLCIYI